MINLTQERGAIKCRTPQNRQSVHNDFSVELEAVRSGVYAGAESGITPQATPRNAGQPALLNRKRAAAYLGVSLRWLESQADIPTLNLAKPRARRATIRYELAELDRFIARRRAEER